MQRTIILLIFLLSGSFSSSFGQMSTGRFNPQFLEVSWELVDNFHNKKAQYLSAFTLTNTGSQPLPAEGWKLYYNHSEHFDPASVSGGFTIEHMNGDLLRLSPGRAFNGLSPGESIRIGFITYYYALNFTDAPIGLYWVWNSDPDNGIPVTRYTIKPVTDTQEINRGPNDLVPVATPEAVYKENKKIRDIPALELIKVFPTPVKYRETGSEFVLNPDIPIQYDASFENEANYLSNEWEKIFGQKPAITAASDVDGKKIQLTKGDTKDEGYRLDVTPESIVISAPDAAGIFYGIQSLKTLMPHSSFSGTPSSVTIPAVEVEDAPRFGHRAFMLDVARNFRSKEQILKTLDLMSLYKLNVFHFHFNDDEGWRIEIPGLPELTQIGAERGHTLDNSERLQPSHGSGPDSAYPGSGYYSTEDFIDILAYAAERHIRVIPEIETPGHARAAIKSMDARYRRFMEQGKEEEARQYLLRDLEDTSEYRSVQGWNDNVINVALPSIYRFLEKVIDELVIMYEKAGAPLNRIHMGGDEVQAGVWEKSPAVKGLIAENPDVNSAGDLWYYFYGKVNDLLNARGLSLYGWEEIGMKEALWGSETHSVPNPGFADKNVLVDVWNNVIGSGAEDLAYRLANAGYKVVLSGVSNFYFDLAYEKSFHEPGLYWGGFLDVNKPFSFIPYNYYKNSDTDLMGRTLRDSYLKGLEQLTEKGRTNIAGIQGLLWAEKLVNRERMEYMLLPKLLGLAERAWAQSPDWATEQDPVKSRELYDQAWSAFMNKIAKRELPRLDHYHGGYHYRIPAAGAVIQDGKVTANVQMPGFTIRYTTDGTKPVADSKIYTEPIDQKGTIKLRVFNGNGRGGRTVEGLRD